MKSKKFYSLEDTKNLTINEVHQLYKDFINPNQTKIFSSLPFGNEVFESAEGVYLYTSNKKKILDFTGGLGVLGLGHNHPRILQARINFQKEKKVEVHKIIFSKYMAALANNISSLLPDNLRKSFFLNSGAEAVEAAIKVSYKSFSKKKKFILFSNKSYHGKLIGSGSISGSYKNDNTFPSMENCESFKFNDHIDLENKIIELEKEGGVYAVILEPYSASMLEPLSTDFINKIKILRKKYNFKLIFDEVFTGFYKSEKMFYFQNFENIFPDIICLSKTFGGGKSSISCLVIDEKVYQSAYGNLSDTFLHTTTYNGFGEESVTALEALSILTENGFDKKVLDLSKYLNKNLKDIESNHKDKIEKIKGTGILNGIIFKSYSTKLAELVDKVPIKFIKDKSYFLKKITATAISCELYNKYNILTAINDSVNSNHLCIAPSLVVENKDIDYFFKSLDQVLKQNLEIKSIETIFKFLNPLK